jgi:N-acetyl-anhydromuramyl-L-alanine amidase AmpD
MSTAIETNTFYDLLPHGGGYQAPEIIVIHVMGEYIAYGGEVIPARELLKREGLSSHSLITPSGVNIRCRKDNQIAYHAKGHNVGSLGMEFLAPRIHDLDSLQALTQRDYLESPQYWKGVEQVREWLSLHNIRKIVRHSDLDPDRRWFDPGDGFPLQIFLQDVGWNG